MIDKIIERLDQLNPADNLDEDQWIHFSKAYFQEKDDDKKIAFVNLLSAHTNFVSESIFDLFVSLEKFETDGVNKEAKTLIGDALKSEQERSLELIDFMQRPFFQTRHIDWLSISKRQLNALFSKFKDDKKCQVTLSYFITTLSDILGIEPETLECALTKKQPDRKAKRVADFSADDEPPRKRNRYHFHSNDKGPNLLIYPKNTQHPSIENKMEASGVRVVPLVPCSPIRGYRVPAMSTPGRTKVRPVISTDAGTLYKPATPRATDKSKGLLEVQEIANEQLGAKLPKLKCTRAQTVHFIATRGQIAQRHGLKRNKSGRAIMGASAADVFRAHGINIGSEANRLYHWYHLIAHFLADERDIKSEKNTNPLINLVATTSAANYNTLYGIEFFIKRKLQNKKIDKIKMSATPIFSDTSIIPDMITYELHWDEKLNNTISSRHEVFYISAKSQFRITRSMHESISILRKSTHASLFSAPSTRQSEPNAVDTPSHLAASAGY